MVIHIENANVATSREELRERYAEQYGVRAGQLPSTLDGLDAAVADLRERVRAHEAAGTLPPEAPSVRAIRELIEGDRRVRGLVELMIDQSLGTTRSTDGSGKPDPHSINDVPELLAALDVVLTEAPTPDNSFPVSAIFAYMMFTPAGWYAFQHGPFNDALAVYLDAYEDFLNSADSLSSINQVDGWLTPAMQRKLGLQEFQIDWDDAHGGFTNYNSFFHRQIKDGVRPLAGEGQDDVVVSANDGVVFKISRAVQLHAKFWTKDQPYSLWDMFGEELAEDFVDGDVFQTYLAGTNYHRWVAPVSGTIRAAEVVPGLMFSELRSVGFDPGGGTTSTAYEASVNTRGIVIIEADDETIGKVAVIPIGITEVSSVKHLYADGTAVQVGDEVTKGTEIGRFSLGGSTLALVFQPGAIASFRWPEPTTPPTPPPADWTPADDPPAVMARDWIALTR